MSALDDFKKKVGIPTIFGKDSPYVRLAAVEEDGSGGVDADVEFLEDPDRIVVTISEWKKLAAGTDREPPVRYEFDAQNGKIISDDPDDLANLLIAVEGMRVLND